MFPDQLTRNGTIDEDHVLSGMPHPSGANAERIKFFLDEKSANELSNKTNPTKISQHRERVMRRVARLRGKL